MWRAFRYLPGQIEAGSVVKICPTMTRTFSEAPLRRQLLTVVWETLTSLAMACKVQPRLRSSAFKVSGCQSLEAVTRSIEDSAMTSIVLLNESFKHKYAP